jgi:hypothetical protein
VPAGVAPLARRALDRINADNSEWRQLWEEAPDSYALAALQPIRAVLDQAGT